MKHGFLIKPRPSDYLQGINSPIPFKAVSSGFWPVWFNEDQRNPNFDDDGCACYSAQKSLDTQVDNLLATLDSKVVNQLSTMGFMQTGLDGKPHFRSSPRFLEIMTGNGLNGNSMPEVFDALRKYGTLPWNDMPFTPTMTEAEYFTKPTPAQLAKAAQFLALMGGNDFCQYHWIENGGTKNVSLMQSVILQAPLGLGIAVTDGWNQPTPADPPATQAVQHAVLAYQVESPTVAINDNYNPYLKVLDAGYPIPYVIQAVVQYIPPPATPTPTPTPIPTTVQPTSDNVTILEAIVAIYQEIILLIKGRQLGTIQMTNFSFLKSGAFWSSVVLVLSAFFTALYSSFPDVTWIGTVVSVLSFLSVNYFHKAAVSAAAVSSAALGKAVSGQS